MTIKHLDKNGNEITYDDLREQLKKANTESIKELEQALEALDFLWTTHCADQSEKTNPFYKPMNSCLSEAMVCIKRVLERIENPKSQEVCNEG